MTSCRAADTLAISSQQLQLTHRQLADDHLALRPQIPETGVVALHTSDAALVAAALTALEGWADEVRLLPHDVTPDPELTIVEASTGGVPGEPPSPERITTWTLYTSGTTGEPKPITHSRASLTRTVVAGSSTGAEYIWGLLYDPNRMAGLQVILQGLLSGASVVSPPLDGPLADRVDVLVEGGVNAISATPTMWRQLLRVPATRQLRLRQITLGGEIADQRVLDSLAHAFPNARIVHVFASTETGAAFSVRDGMAGFPASYLDDPPGGVALQIRGDVLHVFSPGVSASGPDGFASTGDIVEVIADRVHFRGRASGVVNVGGSNVWPEVVETTLREHPDVVDAIVAAKPNPMTGNVLVAHVELRDGVDRTDLAKELRSWVRQRSPRTHVPASIDFVDSLRTTTTGKVAR